MPCASESRVRTITHPSPAHSRMVLLWDGYFVCAWKGSTNMDQIGAYMCRGRGRHADVPKPVCLLIINQLAET
jgi:hypothetical protein